MQTGIDIVHQWVVIGPYSVIVMMDVIIIYCMFYVYINTPHNYYVVKCFLSSIDILNKFDKSMLNIFVSMSIRKLIFLWNGQCQLYSCVENTLLHEHNLFFF